MAEPTPAPAVPVAAKEREKSYLETHPKIDPADLVKPDANGDIPLIRLAESRELPELVKRLHAQGDQLPEGAFTVRDKDGNTMVHLAAGNGQLSAVDSLLKQQGKQLTGDLLQERNNLGATPLHVAAALGRLVETDDVLRANGDAITKADLLVPNRRGENAVHFAASNGDVSEVGKVLRRNVDPVTRQEEVLTAEDLRRKDIAGQDAVQKAAANKQLDKLITPENFHTQPAELEKVWKDVPAADRPQVKINAVREELKGPLVDAQSHGPIRGVDAEKPTVDRQALVEARNAPINAPTPQKSGPDMSQSMAA